MCDIKIEKLLLLCKAFSRSYLASFIFPPLIQASRGYLTSSHALSVELAVSLWDSAKKCDRSF